LGLAPPLYRRRIDFFKKSRAFDITKAKRELGFRPQISLQEGVQQTAHWYEAQGYL
jgi:nucleoside-diphosphate-sugar epimerase